MIRPLAALTRQVQEFFHTELVGIFKWDEVVHSLPEKHVPPDTNYVLNERGRRRRRERPEGRFHAKLEMEFGLWRLTVEGPTEHPPLGLLTLDGPETIDGPLDPATWKRFAALIKKHQEEFSNVI